MKKINFVGYYPGFKPELSREYQVLCRHYDVAICDDPDYVFFSSFGKPYEYLNYDCIRIFYTAENYAPNFNTADYAIGFNLLQAQDRYFRYPVSLYTPYIRQASEKHLHVDEAEYRQRPHFCNFIYGNAKGQPQRAELFHRLNEYKRVESAGTMLNNQPDGWHAASIEQKLDFQRRCKFSIAVDSVQLAGFSTEKITHAFASGTVPIYLGDPLIGNEFNEKAFINGNRLGSVDEIVRKVIEIDQNDEAYFNMLREPIFCSADFLDDFEKKHESFILNIFEQEYQKAFRRSRDFFGLYDEGHLKTVNRIAGSKFLSTVLGAYNRLERKND